MQSTWDLYYIFIYKKVNESKIKEKFHHFLRIHFEFEGFIVHIFLIFTVVND